MVAGKLEQRLGKSFVVENKTGAGSIIAAVAVQKAAPDGYTLLMAPTPTMAVNVALYKSLPYDPLVDFVPLALLAQTPFILVVNAALPVKSIPELIAYAKANAGKMSFASVGPGVPHHLYMEMFKSMTGIEASHVPYRGSLPALNDVIAGHVPMMFVDIGPAAGALQAGTVRPLGVSLGLPRAGLQRDSADQRSRTAWVRSGGLADAGRAGQDAASDRGSAQSRTDRHPGAAGHQGSDSQVWVHSGREQIGRGLQDYVKSETVRWGKVVKDAGIAGSQ